MNYLFERLSEASTYQGLVIVGGLIGWKVSPEKAAAIGTVCIAVLALIKTFFPDKFGAK